MNIMQDTLIKEQLKGLLPNLEGFEPELLRCFVTYWSIRKSDSLDTAGYVNEIKTLHPEQWLSLIESNHKFRNLYGEDAAYKIIKHIEDSK